MTRIVEFKGYHTAGHDSFRIKLRLYVDEKGYAHGKIRDELLLPKHGDLQVIGYFSKKESFYDLFFATTSRKSFASTKKANVFYNFRLTKKRKFEGLWAFPIQHDFVAFKSDSFPTSKQFKQLEMHCSLINPHNASGNVVLYISKDSQ